MPKDNSQRAIARGAGAGAGDEQIERVVYEGYGPGGAAVLVDTLTDNRNRTGAEVRNLFDKSGGNLGEPGSVAWQFEKKGVILVDGDRFSEDDLMPAIDAGAEDVVLDDDVLKLTTDPMALSAVRSALEGAGVEVQSADLAMEPNAVVEIGEEREARALVRLMEALDDHDDVEAVHANFDIPEALLEQVAA
jgi:YebC/PmpR family DNA-binding regulatory protein